MVFFTSSIISSQVKDYIFTSFWTDSCMICLIALLAPPLLFNRTSNASLYLDRAILRRTWPSQKFCVVFDTGRFRLRWGCFVMSFGYVYWCDNYGWSWCRWGINRWIIAIRVSWLLNWLFRRGLTSPVGLFFLLLLLYLDYMKKWMIVEMYDDEMNVIYLRRFAVPSSVVPKAGNRHDREMYYPLQI